MLTEVSSISHNYIACGHTDLRKSIDGLAAIVQESFKMNPFQQTLFLFSGRRFGLSRIEFRERALRGEIPGVVKASW